MNWTAQNVAEFIVAYQNARSDYDKPRKTDEDMQAIVRKLSDLDPIQCLQAVVKHKNPMMPPNPASIRIAVEGDIEGQALKAAEKVEWAVSRRGPYISPVFDDRRTQAVVCALGGWVKTVEMFDAASNPEFVKNKIAKLYKSLPADAEVFDLLGIVDSKNGTGRSEHHTRYIGDEPKARALLSHIEQVKLLGEVK